MDWIIVSIGDAAFLEQVLIAVALVTGTGDFRVIVQITLLLAVLLVAFQAVLNPGRGVQFQQVLLSWIVFSMMYGPSANVVIEDRYTGTIRPVANVPLGVAATGSIISTIGVTITDLFEVAFSTPTMTDYGFAGPVSDLKNVRAAFMDPSRLAGPSAALGSAPEQDVVMSWFNYMKDCTLSGVDLVETGGTGGRTLASIMRDANPINAVRFDSSILGTRVFLSGGVEDLTCTDAFLALEGSLSEFMAALFRTLAGHLGIEGGGGSAGVAAQTRVDNALLALNAAGVTAQNYVATATFLPIFEAAMIGKQMDEHEFNAAVMSSQAIQQRNAQWTVESDLFTSIARPMMTFFEGFTYAVTPMMAVLIALGSFGMKAAAKYLMMLLWVQLWMPSLAILNLYLSMIVSKRLDALSDPTRFDAPITSFSGLLMLSQDLQNWVATAGVLASSIPVISLMLVYAGSAVTATAMARRMQGMDHVNEKIAAPDVMSNAGFNQMRTGFDYNRVAGMRTGGAEGNERTFDFGTQSNWRLSADKTAFDDSMSSFSDSAAYLRNSTVQHTDRKWDSAGFGRQVMASRGEADQFAAGTAETIGSSLGFGTEQKQALSAVLGLGLPRAGIKAALDSKFDSGTTSSVMNKLDDMESSQWGSSFQSAWADRLQQDVAQGRESAFADVTSHGDQTDMRKIAQETQGRREALAESHSLNAMIGSSHRVPGSVLAEGTSQEQMSAALHQLGLTGKVENEMAPRYAGYYGNNLDKGYKVAGYAAMQDLMNDPNADTATRTAARDAYLGLAAGVLGHSPNGINDPGLGTQSLGGGTPDKGTVESRVNAVQPGLTAGSRNPYEAGQRIRQEGVPVNEPGDGVVTQQRDANNAWVINQGEAQAGEMRAANAQEALQHLSNKVYGDGAIAQYNPQTWAQNTSEAIVRTATARMNDAEGGLQTVMSGAGETAKDAYRTLSGAMAAASSGDFRGAARIINNSSPFRAGTDAMQQMSQSIYQSHYDYAIRQGVTEDQANYYAALSTNRIGAEMRAVVNNVRENGGRLDNAVVNIGARMTGFDQQMERVESLENQITDPVIRDGVRKAAFTGDSHYLHLVGTVNNLSETPKAPDYMVR